MSPFRAYLDHNVFVHADALGQNDRFVTAMRDADFTPCVSTEHIQETLPLCPYEAFRRQLDVILDGVFERVPRANEADALEILEAFRDHAPTLVRGDRVPAELPDDGSATWAAVEKYTEEKHAAFLEVYETNIAPMAALGVDTMDRLAKRERKGDVPTSHAEGFLGMGQSSGARALPDDVLWRAEMTALLHACLVDHEPSVGDLRVALEPYIVKKAATRQNLTDFVTNADPNWLPRAFAFGNLALIQTRQRITKGNARDLNHYGAALTCDLLVTEDKRFHDAVAQLRGMGLLAPQSVWVDRNSQDVAKAVLDAVRAARHESGSGPR